MNYTCNELCFVFHHISNMNGALCSGYLPPEYIEKGVVSNKLDIFSLGVIIIKIISGPTGYTQCAEMPSKQFVELVRKFATNDDQL